MTGVTIYFATNRNYLPDNKKAVFGPRFNADGVAALRFGSADYDVDGRHATLGKIDVFDEQMAADPAAGFTATGSATLLSALRDRMAAGETDTLVFIHGFNVSFLDALAAGARIAAELPRPYNVVVFSWPSDGEAVPFMSYYSDREDARASGPALARAYLKLFDFVSALPEEERCHQRLHLIAHSMGCYVLRQGVQAVRAKDSRRIVRLFDQIVLAAADEDDDCFETDDKLRPLPGMGRRITVYHNRFDRALLISDKTKANPDRLGSDGPRMMDLLPKKVIIVDCSRLARLADPIVQHSYYINNASVAADLAATLDDVETDAIGNREVIRADYSFRIIA